jgi:eukaryotic-like serine/threonine-protein kinase
MTGQAAPSQGAHTPAIGDVIAQKYRVESIVGQGGMGVVVCARHVQLGQAVAIKLLTLPPDEDRRDEAIARFLHEAQAAARLRNDHVVSIYDVGQLEDGLPFMVMELLNGSDLGSVLDERGALPEAEAVDYVLQACAGVGEAHQLGIVHRDLKPSNLFLTRRSDGWPLIKVLDFGISKQLSDPSSGQASPTFTNTRTLMGSPNYMSPEQIRDARRVDARADVWAMGIILQELITDAPVFHGESFPGVCAAIVADPPMPVRTMRPDVSVKLEAIIGRCLEKDVNKRYQSIAELVAELSPLGIRASLSGSGPQPLVYSSHPRLVPAKAVPITNRSETDAKASSLSPAAHDERTVALASSADGRRGGPDGTLESARLDAARASTHSPFSGPDSRIEVLGAPLAAPATKRSLSRIALPAGLLVLVLGGAAWWQSRSVPAATSTSAEAPTPSAPTTVPEAFTLSIDSEPAGASVSEGSTRLGTTPFTLSLSLPEGAAPRAFVLEKEGFEPYVVRQGPARGLVRVMASLSRSPEPPQAPAAPASVARSVPPPAIKSRPHASKPPPPPVSKPPSDIRLER